MPWLLPAIQTFPWLPAPMVLRSLSLRRGVAARLLSARNHRAGTRAADTGSSPVEAEHRERRLCCCHWALSNLALLGEAYPGLLAHANLVLMGGHPRPIPAGYPPWDHTNDWNVQYDVTSAQYIFAHTSPTIVPLEVTVQTALRRASSPRCAIRAPSASFWRAKRRLSPRNISTKSAMGVLAPNYRMTS